jgi:hypothetical protein
VVDLSVSKWPRFIGKNSRRFRFGSALDFYSTPPRNLPLPMPITSWFRICIRIWLYSIIINYNLKIAIRYGLSLILRPRIMEGCITFRYDYVMVWGSYLIIILSPNQVSRTDVSAVFNCYRPTYNRLVDRWIIINTHSHVKSTVEPRFGHIYFPISTGADHVIWRTLPIDVEIKVNMKATKLGIHYFILVIE